MDDTPHILENQVGDERVGFCKRPDGRYTFNRAYREEASGLWSEPGPDCGIDDSLLTAETEARQRVDWLKAQFH